MADFPALELHHVDVVRARALARRWHRPAGTAVRAGEDAVGADIVPLVVGGERFHLAASVGDKAEQTHAYIRRTLTNLYGADLAQAISIQYGGSVKPDNAEALLAQPNIDGALVGGASLKVEDFAPIVQAAVRLAGG